MNSKTVIIYCRTMELGGDPFTGDYYWQAYQDLLFALKDRGIQAYFASGNETYAGGGVFSKVYGSDHKVALSELKTFTDVHADLVFDRGGFMGRDVAVINDPELIMIADNKIETYKRLAHLQPYSIICEDRQQLQTASTLLPGDMMVVKDPNGRGGYEVFIGPKDEVLTQTPDKYPLLAQEFFDTAAGVPGVSEGVHDVRVSIAGGQVVGYYIRHAKPGALHSNVSQGGTMEFLDIATVAPEIRQMVRKIDTLFANYPRYYSADFMHTTHGWKLVELNPYLALLPVTDGTEAIKTLYRLANYLAHIVYGDTMVPAMQGRHESR